MSLTTRCPACHTTFRVVPDQLKVSEGWVRCGRCHEVFDARASLSPHLPVMTEVVETPAELRAEPPDSPPTDPSPAAEPIWVEPALADSPLDSSLVSPAGGSVPPPAAASAPTPAPEPGAEVAIPHTSFMRRAQRAAFWRRPGVRWALGLSAVALTLGLVGQLMYHQRDWVAQRLPGLRPVVVGLCQALQCQVGVPRRIEAVSIEASTFTRLPPEAFRLQVTLANADPLAVAMPAVELTLTDTQDQPVIRRVLQPADLGPDTPAALPASGEWSATVTLTVAPAHASAIAGYRLLAFYP